MDSNTSRIDIIITEPKQPNQFTAEAEESRIKNEVRAVWK